MDFEYARLGTPEKSRTYVFADRTLVLQDVTHLEVRASGKHRFQTADGRKGFVNTGWLWIELDVEQWSM